MLGDPVRREWTRRPVTVIWRSANVDKSVAAQISFSSLMAETGWLHASIAVELSLSHSPYYCPTITSPVNDTNRRYSILFL